MTTLAPALVPAQNLMLAQEQQFNAVLSDEKINFQKEVTFALQHLGNNDYLRDTAMRNQESFRNAILNLATIGVSLNPALKQAYLVPRKGNVTLDIGYLGLEYLAIESGSVLWVQSKIVYGNDNYESMGIDKAPQHTYSPFGNRGDIVGAYCVAKIHDGSFLTEEMTIAEIYKIRERSESFKKGSMSPWKTDEGEMIKKTVIKRASKGWPKAERLQKAVQFINEGDEGIDFQSERAMQQRGPKAVNQATEEQIKQIQEGLEFLGRPVGAFLQWFGGAVAKRHIEDINDLSEHDAGQAIAKINQLLDAQAAKAEKSGEVF